MYPQILKGLNINNPECKFGGVGIHSISNPEGIEHEQFDNIQN